MSKRRNNTTKATNGNAADPVLIAIEAANKLGDVTPTTDASADAWAEACENAVSTVPTTNAGALALIEFALSDEEGRHHAPEALRTLRAFLKDGNPDAALIAIGPQIVAAVTVAIAAHDKFKATPEADNAARDIAYKHWNKSALPLHDLCREVFQHKPQTVQGFAVMALAAAAVNYDGMGGTVDCPEACALIVALCDATGLPMPQPCGASLRKAAAVASAPMLED
jgi:hypothetical protein